MGVEEMRSEKKGTGGNMRVGEGTGGEGKWKVRDRI